MTFHFSFIGLTHQFTVLAQRFQQVVPAKTSTEIQVLCYIGYRSASAAVAEHFTLIKLCWTMCLNSRDFSLQLMPLDLAWRGVCNETYLAVQNLIYGILLANNRVTKCKTIGILSQMLNNFTIFEVPSDLDNISMKLTELGLSKGIPEFDA